MVIDIDPPSNSHIVSDIDIEGSIHDFDSDGRYLYFANHETGMQVVNIDSPRSPFLVATLAMEIEYPQIGVSGTSACITNSIGDVYLVNISDPTRPEVVDRIEMREGLAQAIQTNKEKQNKQESESFSATSKKSSHWLSPP